MIANLGYELGNFSLGYALKNEERLEPAPKIDLHRQYI